jgi:hypothetical protein
MYILQNSISCIVSRLSPPSAYTIIVEEFPYLVLIFANCCSLPRVDLHHIYNTHTHTHIHTVLRLICRIVLKATARPTLLAVYATLNLSLVSYS